MLWAAASSFGFAVYAWRRRGPVLVNAFLALALALGTWSGAYGLELAAAPLRGQIFWARIEYLGIVAIAPSWFILAAAYTHRRAWLGRSRLLLLAVIPTITLLLLWSNELHGLIWSRTGQISSGGLSLLDVDYGYWFWIHTGYSYLLLVTGSVVLLGAVLRSAQLYRSQAVALVISALTPLFSNVLYLLGLDPLPRVDLTPLSFSVALIASGWAIFRYHLLDIVPVARDRVIERMADGVIVLDQHDAVVDINPAARRLLEPAEGELLGRQAVELFAPWPDLVARFHEPEGQRTQIAVEGRDERRYYDLRVTTLEDRQGRRTGRLIVLRNITDLRRATESLEKAKEAAEAANVAKSRFLATVSHELRTPLNAIIGYSELLEEEAVEHEMLTLAGDLGRIRSAGHQLLEIINTILDLSKVEAGEMKLAPETFSVSRLLAEVVDTAAPLMAINENRLILDVSEEVGYLYNDQRKLRQILLNLLSNAAKFTGGGRIVLSASHHLRGDAPWLCFAVQDEGIGMSADQLTEIFRPFTQVDSSYTRRYEGTGLGLTICRHFSRLMGGDIDVDSEIGLGTTFRLWLPARTEVTLVDPLLGTMPVP